MVGGYRFSILMLLMVVALVALGGCSGGGNAPLDPLTRPVITQLSHTGMDIGDTLAITGTGFGSEQVGSTAMLNGIEFVVTAWSDTRIEAVVAAGMTTGTVVVTVNGLASQVVAAAQLEISPDWPTIVELSRVSGYSGDLLTISGHGFGAEPGRVVFRDTTGTETEADILEVENADPPAVRWAADAIIARVPPLGSVAYTVLVITDIGRSNALPFSFLPGAPYEHPVITEVTPPSGAAGTAVTITGDSFGHEQAGSTLTINDLPLEITAWSYTEIAARIPESAVTGKILITVEGKQYSWPPDAWGSFIVAQSPLITGLMPAEVRLAHPLTILGNHFGTAQGTGSVRVGGTVQTVSSWAPTPDPNIQLITIDALKPFSMPSQTQYDGDGKPIVDMWGNPAQFYQVVVRADNGLYSAGQYVRLVTDLKAEVTVSPAAGQRSGLAAGETGTEFVFSVDVTGGSGSYTYNLIPDKTKPASAGVDQNPATTEIEYTYPGNVTEPDVKTYLTLMRIDDEVNGDSVTVAGPTVLVVQYGVPVITELGLADFNRGEVQAPNDWCYLPVNASYHDFTFTPNGPRITSAMADVMSDGTALPSYPRDLTDFKIDGATPRGQGYRYYHDEMINPLNDGAIISVKGLNFGEAPGEVWLNVYSPPSWQVTDYYTAGGIANGWSDTEIQFYLPAATLNLSGAVHVMPVGSDRATNSGEPLICSPYVLLLAPNSDVSLTTGVITLTGFDFQPPTVPGKVGQGLYSIWMVRASYTDPWTSSAKTGLCLLTTPVPPSSVAGTALQFSLADLDLDGNGTVPVEVTSSSGDEAAVVEGTLEEGNYYFFLWTGVLAEGSSTEIANSGIFSESYAINVFSIKDNQTPLAVLYATPDSGSAPLIVSLNGSGSTDDGAITDYEWDFDGDGNFNEAGEEATAQGSPGPHNCTYIADGDYLVRLRVTDDGTPALTDTASHVVLVGPTGSNNLTLRIKINLNGFSGGETIETRCWLFCMATQPNPPPGGPDIPVGTFNMPVNDGQFVSHTFYQQDNGDPLIDGTYWIQVARLKTEWSDGSDLTTMLGPFTMPPDQTVSITGDQYDDFSGSS